MRHRVGIDIGGTFTDFAIVEVASGRLATHKQLTTPEDPSIAVLAGLDALLAREAVAIAELGAIVHGTTLVTNAIVERRGARVGMLVTEGFRDVLDVAKETRYDLFDLRLRYAKPVVPRSLRVEVAERVRYDGAILQALDLDAVRRQVDSLVARAGVEGIAICLLHSYANPAHEQAIKALIEREHPALHVSASAEISPVMREFERWTTTTINAYTQPRIDRYLRALEAGLARRGFAGNFHLMTSNGGTITPETARRFPVRLMESGPAAGVLMCARLGRELGLGELLSFDMGGTTSKGALLSGFAPLKHYELEVARVHNFKRGSGLPLLLPVIDMIEIGTGGGSIAQLDKRSILRVGPRSAGARPGPACYALGGDAPTLTDANLLLGYLDPGYFLDGQMTIAPERAAAVIERDLGRPADLPTVRAAWGIHETANEDVARAFRVHAAERGFDYRVCSMIAFGGSGPLHALRIARKLHIPRVIFPIGAGVMSAFGLLVSPMNNEAIRTDHAFLAGLAPDDFESRFCALEDAAAGLIQAAGAARREIQFNRRLDMRYRGQGYQVEIVLPAEARGADALAMVPALFEAAYRKIFAVSFADQVLEIVDWKVEATGPTPPLPRDGFQLVDIGARGARASLKGERRAWFPEASDFVACAVHDRYALRPGQSIDGPALIEDKESTCIIGIRDRVVVDARFNLVAEVARADVSHDAPATASMSAA